MATLQEILDMDKDGFPIPSIEKAQIIKIGDRKTGGDGKPLQFITVQKGEYELRMRLGCETFILDPDKHLDSFVSFMAGPPVKGKPAGLTLFCQDNKLRVNADSSAVMKLGSTQEEQVKQEEPTAVTEEPQLTETVTVEHDELFEAGPNDHVIEEFLAERIHIYDVLRMSAPNGITINFDSPWITGIHIELGKTNKKILASQGAHQTKKKRFDPIEKPHNPPTKKAEPEEMTDETIIADFLKEHNKCGWHSVSNGFKQPMNLNEVMMVPAKRRKAMMWYHAIKFSDEELKSKSKMFYEALGEMFNEAPASLQNFFAIEALKQDCARITGLDWDDETNVELETLATSCITSYKGNLMPSNAKGIVAKYFNDDEKSRETNMHIPF